MLADKLNRRIAVDANLVAVYVAIAGTQVAQGLCFMGWHPELMGRPPRHAMSRVDGNKGILE
jgi:hypothetical protein